MITESSTQIVIRGAREHNLKNVSLDIPREKLVVITGLSGSGKSSLAFDTIYAEGQRRYLESLSAYARQFLGMMERPDVDYIGGLSPVIAIGQKTRTLNPRSTVGTITEVNDFLRLLFARVATAYSHVTGKPLTRQSPKDMVDTLLAYDAGAVVSLLAPVVRGRKGHYQELFEQIGRQGFTRVRVDGKIRPIKPEMRTQRYHTHDIEVVIDRIKIGGDIRARVAQSVEMALQIGSGALIVSEQGAEDRVFSRSLYDAATGNSFSDASPNTFSFNSPYGACDTCKGLGVKEDFVEDLVLSLPACTINEGGLEPLLWLEDTWFLSMLRPVAKKYGFDFDTPIVDLSRKMVQVILHGAGEERFDVTAMYEAVGVRYMAQFGGLFDYLRRYISTRSDSVGRKLKEFQRELPCPDCEGKRLKAEPLLYRIGEKTIADLVQMDLVSLYRFMESLQFDARAAIISTPIIKEIVERLSFMIDVGVGYLNLDRMARSLSGGESQRIRLATQIGTQLTGVLYVLDEPTIGLHSRDNRRLINSLRQLRDLGNSVLVVEHDREMIESADYVVDLGPGAGERGGYVVGAGEPADLPLGANGFDSLTAQYLSGGRHIAIPSRRRKPSRDKIVLTGAVGHNLKGDTLRLPIGLFICVTGVSGSGKSTLVNHTLYPILSDILGKDARSPLSYEGVRGYEHIDKVIDIDQKPIGRTPRSNPATYIRLFTLIRDLFAMLPESMIRGYGKGRYSFNVKGGRCETCSGAGIVRLEMNFLPDVYVECETCKGRRYNAETLEVLYKGKSIADVLEMTVDEALAFFEHIPRIERKLRTLHSVGLGYIHLGQQSTTISGGEAQRVKLSKELSRPGTGDTLYILDEPTTGLHFEDIRYLLAVLQALVEKGNTVLVIEHNIEVIKVADHIIDLGPEGGEEGGRILFAGTPEALAKQDTYTGAVLKEALREDTAAQVGA